jgi:hypothetical protein
MSADKTINTGGPAFPLDELDPHERLYAQHFGMTLRDYFAAAAMKGFCANSEYNQYSPQVVANESYNMADAMLAARDKE